MARDAKAHEEYKARSEEQRSQLAGEVAQLKDQVAKLEVSPLTSPCLCRKTTCLSYVYSKAALNAAV
jgi:hypothetical protein